MKRRLIIAATMAAVILSTSALAQGRHYRFNQTNTPGWSLMSAEERTEHQKKMLAAKTYDECKAIQEEQHKAMEARAKEKGATLGAPKTNACDNMKAKGLIK